MAATTGGYKFVTHSPSPHALADQASPVFPDRLIRPLPKRRIRSRLSSEQADSIIYPPASACSPPVFNSPRDPVTRAAGNNRWYDAAYDGAADDHDHDHEHVCGCGEDLSGLESEDEEDKLSLSQRYSWPGRMTRLPRQQMEAGINRLRAPPPNSSTSSADGYESFENSNNKKKRKIPVSGPLGSGADNIEAAVPSHLLDDLHGNLEQYYASGAAVSSSSPHSLGVAGAGRGRYSRGTTRNANDRRPLASSTNLLNTNAFNLVNNVKSKVRRDWVQTGGITREYPSTDQGIISAAIANAEAAIDAEVTRRGPKATMRGQENISLLQRQQDATGQQQQKDFTFECKSISSNKLGATPLHLPALPSTARPVGRGSIPRMPLQGPPQTGNKPHNGEPPLHHASLPQEAAPYVPGHPLPPERKPRRNPRREYALAARQRRLQQEYNNYHHPPAGEDVWICGFCEYESIFGMPPVALVRLYEIKDRKERLRVAEKRRLLEKAKAKGRKNKKGTKGATNKNAGPSSSSAAPLPLDAAAHHGYDDLYDGAAPPGDLNGQDDDFYDDGYDDTPGPSPHRDFSGALHPAYVDEYAMTQGGPSLPQTQLPGPGDKDISDAKRRYRREHRASA